MPSRSRVQELAREYVGRFPKSATLTIAKKLAKDHPKVYGDDPRAVERARDAIRYIRGAKGVRHRKKVGDKSHFRDPVPVGLNFERLPPSRTKPSDFKPVKVKDGNILVLCDAHVPYHSTAALEIALEYGYKKSVDHIILLGDFLDFYSISRWEPDPEERDFPDEIYTAIATLEFIRNGFPDAQVTFMRGNHEERYERYVKVRAPDLIGIECFGLGALLSLEKLNIELVPERHYLQMGKLYGVHGHEFGGGVFSPVNAARGLFMRGLECAICGHWHRTSQHTEPTMKGREISTYGVGALCDLHPKYRPHNKWNWGFAHILLEKQDFEVNNFRILEVGKTLKVRR